MRKSTTWMFGRVCLLRGRVPADDKHRGCSRLSRLQMNTHIIPTYKGVEEVSSSTKQDTTVSECAIEWVSKSATEEVSEWSSEWVSEWVSKQASEQVSESALWAKICSKRSSASDRFQLKQILILISLLFLSIVLLVFYFYYAWPPQVFQKFASF